PDCLRLAVRLLERADRGDERGADVGTEVEQIRARIAHAQVATERTMRVVAHVKGLFRKDQVADRTRCRWLCERRWARWLEVVAVVNAFNRSCAQGVAGERPVRALTYLGIAGRWCRCQRLRWQAPGHGREREHDRWQGESYPGC